MMFKCADIANTIGLPNRRGLVLLVLMTLMSAFVYAQQATDYVVLRSEKPDTLFGQIELPTNGIFLNVKITTPTGERKFKTKEVIGLKAGDIYFASIPYGKSYAIVPRIIDGTVDLYFYNSGLDRLSFISQMQDEISRDVWYGSDSGLPITEVIWKETSHFYVFEPNSNRYYKVPQSGRKFKELSHVFKANDEISYNIKTGVYKPNQIGSIVKQYNRSFETH